ncbi:hemerythrin domain-containing protein [Methanobacterium sp. ACI-7]|uniref:hemerythrin domain-containing protein n=1 Tax=unclassified Methanobacterium TaxID=2627676 RepID=UPI0039C3EE50
MTYDKLYGMLEHDHEEVKQMFKDALQNEDTSKFREIKKELEIHMMGEERFYYPKAKKADKELVQHGIEEHEEAKGLIKELDQIPDDSSKFMSKLKELKEAVEHHVEEEEGKLFPKTQKTLDDNEEKQIATQIEEEKSKMM